MSDLPYLQPDKDVFLNASICILIIGFLSSTKRKKKVLTIDKLQTFYFLVMRPAFLNKVLAIAGKPQVFMEREEYYTVDNLAVNVDELFNRGKLKEILKVLSAKKIIDFTYDQKDGFLVELSPYGTNLLNNLGGNYLIKIRRYLDGLSALQSESSSKLSGYINHVLRLG